MVFSRVPAVKCASSTVAVLIRKRVQEQNIRLSVGIFITVKFGLKFLKITITIIGVFVLVEGQNGETNGVYEELQETIEKNK